MSSETRSLAWIVVCLLFGAGVLLPVRLVAQPVDEVAEAVWIGVDDDERLRELQMRLLGEVLDSDFEVSDDVAETFATVWVTVSPEGLPTIDIYLRHDQGRGQRLEVDVDAPEGLSPAVASVLVVEYLSASSLAWRRGDVDEVVLPGAVVVDDPDAAPGEQRQLSSGGMPSQGPPGEAESQVNPIDDGGPAEPGTPTTRLSAVLGLGWRQGGVGAAYVPSLGAGYRRDQLDAHLSLALPRTTSTPGTSAGELEIAQLAAGVDVSYLLGTSFGALGPELTMGLVRTHASGSPAPTYRGHEETLWTTQIGAGIRARWGLWGGVELIAHAGLQTALVSIGLQVLDEDVAVVGAPAWHGGALFSVPLMHTGPP